MDFELGLQQIALSAFLIKGLTFKIFVLEGKKSIIL